MLERKEADKSSYAFAVSNPKIVVKVYDENVQMEEEKENYDEFML